MCRQYRKGTVSSNIMSTKMFVIYKNPSNQYKSFVEKFSLQERKKDLHIISMADIVKKSNSILKGRKPEQESQKSGAIPNPLGRGETICTVGHIFTYHPELS